MANDLFGGLGGLMKGLSSLMPQDDPKVKLMTAESEVSDLKKQEHDIYAEIGKRAAATNGLDSYGELGDKLRLVQSNLQTATQTLQAAKSEKEQAEEAKKSAEAQNTCPACGHLNPEGTKFCQECGGKLGAKNFCTSCGAENPPGTRFCGSCGAKQGE